MAEDKVICQVCGALVVNTKFCSKCGSRIFISEKDETIEINNKFEEISQLINDLRFSIYPKLHREAERNLLYFRDAFDTFYDEYKEVLKSIEEIIEFESKHPNKTICQRCKSKITKTSFCSNCGSSLSNLNVRVFELRYSKITNIIQRFNIFMTNLSDDILTEDNKQQINNISLNLNFIEEKITSRQNFIVESLPKVRRPVAAKPIIQPVTREITTPSQQMATTQITKETGTPAMQEMRILEEKKSPSAYSKFERNLVNYWFFYLSIFLLTIGVIITIVFVVREITSVPTQLAVIYSIGAGILIIGQTVSIVLNKRKQKAKQQAVEKMKDEESTEKLEALEEQQQQERKFPLPEFANVIVFIGIIVLYVAGIVGLGSTLPRGIFIYVSFGISLLAIFLGTLNDSEMVTLTGFIPIFAFIIMDLTWGATPALNEVMVFIAFIVPIIASTIIGIFYNKWWGAIVNITVIPIVICLPFVSTQMGLEFIPLILIPISTLLIVRFNKEGKIPFIHKRILSALSLIMPMIGLAITAFPIFNYSETEPTWARVFPVEIIIGTVVLLAISYSYQFIQEKYLDIKSKSCIFYYIGQAAVGIVALLMIFTNIFTLDGFIYNVIYFGIFFIVGILGLIAKLEKYLTQIGTIISFAIAEIHAILLLSILGDVLSPGLTLAIQFIITIIFTILVITTILLKKVLTMRMGLFISWMVASLINNIIFIFIQQANYWFVFGSLMLFLVIPALSLEPHKKIPYYISQASIGILSLFMTLVNLSNPYGYIFNLIYIGAFLVYGVMGLIFQDYFSKFSSIFSFIVAEIQAILLLILLNTSTVPMTILYFIIAISFTLVAIANIGIARKREVTKYDQILAVVCVVINTTLLMFMQKTSDWYILAALLIFFALPALNIKPNVDIPYYIGQISLGILVSLMIGLNYKSNINYIYNIVAFALFLTMGIIGSFKKMQNYFKLPNTIISFVFAEILAILSLTLTNVSTNVQISLYFISAISFLVLCFLSISLTKIAEISDKLYISWLCFSFINSVLLIFLKEINNWFVFTTLLLFFAITTLEVKPSTGAYRLAGQIGIGLLSIMMVLYNITNPNYFIYNIVYFGIFFIVGFMGLFKFLKNYFKEAGTLISLIFAEIQAIMLLSLTTVTNPFETVLYFIVAISFTCLAIITLSLSKFFINNEYLLFAYIFITAVNNALVGFSNKVNSWFSFAAMILLLVLVALNNIPTLIQKMKLWRINALTSAVIALILISIFLFTNHLNIFPYETVVVFGLFVLINVPVFINWKKEEVAINE